MQEGRFQWGEEEGVSYQEIRGGLHGEYWGDGELLIPQIP